MGGGTHLTPRRDASLDRNRDASLDRNRDASHVLGRELSPERSRELSPERSEERLRRSVAVLADQLALAERLLPCSCTSLRLLLREIEDNARYLAGESERE